MGYSPWYLCTENKKIFIHKDNVHSTMLKNMAKTFTSWSDADEYAKEKGLTLSFKPIQAKDLK